MFGSLQSRETKALAESKPLLRELPQVSMGHMWLGVIVASLVTAWCILDSWNHDINSQLAEWVQMGDANVSYALTLAFILFAFAAFVFLGMFLVSGMLSGQDIWLEIKETGSTMNDGRWGTLVVSHMLSSILLQSLMMPRQIMSLGIFAATRAVESPTAASFRSKVFNDRFGGHSPKTIALIFISTWIIFYSYTQIAECLCVWSGFGVALTGPALYILYVLLLTVPAVNVVCQESVMVQLQVNPLLMLALQNFGACILLAPLLLAAHVFGQEDVLVALSALLFKQRAVSMIVVWLSIQMAMLAGVTVGLIYVTDSYWTVAARGLRAVFWWAKELMIFYLTSNTYLSIARPNSSVWSFAMLCGVAIGIGAIVIDSREETPGKHAKQFSSSV